MPKLEARFHPWSPGSDSYVVVGYVSWDPSRDDRPLIQPAHSLREACAPHAIFATLRHLVAARRTDYTRLASLRSRFWSFIPAEDPESASPQESRDAC
jgi:hypothetical protein